MILPLEQQVVSLESAKRLKELGCLQESLFYWCGYKSEFMAKELFVPMEYDSNRHIKWHSAFTASELGELMPVGYGIIKSDNWIIAKSQWRTENDENWIELRGFNQRDSNLAEAIAKLLIYLMEHNLIESKGRNGEKV